MFPHLVQLGPFTLSTYGAAFALSFLLTVGLAAHAARHARKGLVPLNDEQVVDWGVWTIAGGVIGGRMLYVATSWEAFARQPLEIFALWHGGLIFHGGLIGGIMATVLFCRRRGVSALRVLDQVIPFATLGHALGRLGCFANGCCYGKPSTAWCSVKFPEIPHTVLPTQLFESILLVGLYLILRACQTPRLLSKRGSIFAVYLIGYGILRWVIELWRVNPTAWAGQTLQQLISILLVVGGSVLLTAPRR